ncbi:4919_t:CDS:2 [Paraglomus brasilianum]|uniref:4919_t:CDS:1 n=1 Tax=Paraglomus brasilianum TaxID=144538 RepID=A0A9N9CIM8_9GLOM|nr:4919_t:CDS:2 [Paraglomus brasilianum]
MAKSMRSKSKRRFRAIKRQNVFAPVEEARLRRLAAKQAEATRVSDNKNNKNSMDYEAQTTTVEEDTQAVVMDVDAPKISTSTPKNGRYKGKKKGKKRGMGKTKRKILNALVHFRR